MKKTSSTGSGKKTKKEQHPWRTFDPYLEKHSPNGWWIEDLRKGDSRLIQVIKNEYHTNYVDRKVKYCTVCERVWERHPYIHGTRSETEYYSLVPKMGKRVETCGECK